MLIDTHAHLDFPDFEADLPDVISRASQAGVTEIIAMATRIETSQAGIRIAAEYPNVWATAGIHPLEVGDAPPDAVAQLRQLAMQPRVVAIGEIGLDYHALDADPVKARETKDKQAELFAAQLELAAELGLNVNLHIREGYDPELWRDALHIITPFTGKLRAVFHCFKGRPEQVAQVAEMGHLVSFTGFATYPDMPQIAATAAAVNIRHFMLETDAPFQRPPPRTEDRCEPAFLTEIAEHIAQLRGISLEELAEETTRTAHEFYRLTGTP